MAQADLPDPADGSVSGWCFTGSFEWADSKDQRKTEERNPADHTETIHERQEHALAKELLVDKTQRSRTRVGAGETIMHQRGSERMRALVQRL